MALTFGEETVVTSSTLGGGDDPTLNLKHSPFQENVKFRIERCVSLPLILEKETRNVLVIKLMRLDKDGKDVCEERLFPSMLTKDLYDKSGNLIDRSTKNSFGRALLAWATVEGVVKGVEEDKGKLLICHRLSYIKEDGKKATWVALDYVG